MVSPEDLALMAAAGRGDGQAQRELARRLLPRVRTSVSYLAFRSSDADDLVQVSLVEVLRSAGTFRGESSIETWADRITARTVARGLRRAHARQEQVEATAELPDVPDVGEGDADPATRALLRRRLVELMERVPLENRVPVLYKYVYGYSLEEIAELVEAPVNTVRNRLLRGKARLRALLAGQEEDS